MKSFLIILFLFSAFIVNAQTSGTLTFSVTTVNYQAQYSPKHILAIWIEDGSGNWVKTREFRSQNPVYKNYLTNFKSATNNSFNVVDATTGATLNSHITHTIDWDGTDVNETLVADGDYSVFVEFTSANATGKLYSINFVKGPNAQTLSPSNQSYFQNISLIWTPDVTQVPYIDDQKTDIVSYPNPFKNSVTISYRSKNSDPVQMNIYDAEGKLVRQINKSAAGDYLKFVWNGTDANGCMQKSGIYYFSISQGDYRIFSKVLKL